MKCLQILSLSMNDTLLNCLKLSYSIDTGLKGKSVTKIKSLPDLIHNPI